MQAVINLLIVSVILAPCEGENSGPPTVHLDQGVLQGKTEKSRGDRNYSVFYGVPFGKVEKRFEMSKPADGWSGVRMATENGPECMHASLLDGKVTGSEDCLNLDVYTPKLASNDSEKLLPVLVWIYGGGFAAGSNRVYGGSYFMDEEVILVVINYRVGAFGFLNAGVSSARGNQGMKDQVLALRWVRDNIHHFSGDKDKVTIFGQSAGGISVSLLTVSPMATGLFSRAIMQSGTAGMPFFFRGLAGRDVAVKLAQEVDCPSSNMQYLVECLQRLDAKVIVKNTRLNYEFGHDESSVALTGPTYETYLPPDNSTGDVFLTESPYDLIVAGKFAKVPIIMGFVACETCATVSATLKNPTFIKKLNHQWGRIAPNALFISNTAEDPALVSQAIKAHFLGDDYINETIYSKFEALYSDRQFVHSTRIYAEIYAKHVPVYLYNFTQMVPIVKFGTATEGEQTRKVPGHADEISYIFDGKGELANYLHRIGKGHDDEKFSKETIATWVAFADTGKPSGPWENLAWPTFKPDEKGTAKWLRIENPPKVEPLPDSWEVNNKFWKGLNIKEFGGTWKSDEL
ncbi:carboxylesterase 5A [Folsomia candida]|nr:carboxylesterase 5A [Folsomia candida]